MASVNFNIQVDAINVEKVLNAVSDRLTPENLELWLRGPAHEYIAQTIEWNFEGEGSAAGRWEPLHEATINLREFFGYGAGPINVRTGELKKVLTTAADYSLMSDGAQMVLPGEAGTANPIIMRKLTTAQQGNPSNNLPDKFGPTGPRPPLAFSEYNAEVLLNSLGAWLANDLASSLEVGF